jgi:hypothetical protein
MMSRCRVDNEVMPRPDYFPFGALIFNLVCRISVLGRKITVKGEECSSLLNSANRAKRQGRFIEKTKEV